MEILCISLLSLFVTQFWKLFLNRLFYIKRIISTGGMPSSHAAFVSTLSTKIALKYGFYSDAFAAVAVFSSIIIYDAGGLRRNVGQQASILKKIINYFSLVEKEEFRGAVANDLKELVGHTPFEVFVGVLLGIAIALLSEFCRN